MYFAVTLMIKLNRGLNLHTILHHFGVRPLFLNSFYFYYDCHIRGPVFLTLILYRLVELTLFHKSALFWYFVEEIADK